MAIRVFVLLVLFSAIGNVACDTWKFQRSMGASITFNCSESTAPPTASPRYWILNTLQIVPLDFNDGVRWVAGGGALFHISRINSSHPGIYHCATSFQPAGGPNGSAQVFLVKRALNIDGPTFGNLWVRYRTNVLVAFLAMGVFLAIILMIYLTAKFRWVPPEGPAGAEPVLLLSDSGEVMIAGGYYAADDGHSNKAFVLAGEDAAVLVKMDKRALEEPTAGVMEKIPLNESIAAAAAAADAVVEPLPEHVIVVTPIYLTNTAADTKL